MSKIGRKPIQLNNVQIDIKDNTVHFKGKKVSGTYVLPQLLKAQLSDNGLLITCETKTREANRVWGLHRALLANEIIGAQDGFTQQIMINGLGFKGAVAGNRIDFTLGFSHKGGRANPGPFYLPEGVTAEVDKTGQTLTIKGTNKEVVGLVCSKIRQLRKPEPYKGTGIRVGDEVIIRKAGKTKAS